ncbi:MAG: glycosyltransferase family 2 protein, partial [Armatimonadetes bacterium]|nr:glycosyltransferase family 2 protein [Armatimonadota bacterium]
MMPAISIVIPTYNRLNTLKLALDSLVNQNFPKEQYEILICDNNSTDGTKEWINNLNQFNLKYLRGENKGRSGARNRGIKASKGEIILFTDADIIADGNLLKEHFKFHHRQKENIAVVGREIQINTIAELNNNEIFAKTLHSKGRKKLPWLYFLTGNASARKKDLITSGMF